MASGYEKAECSGEPSRLANMLLSIYIVVGGVFTIGSMVSSLLWLFG